MKSFRLKPRHGLAEPAIWCAGIGLLCFFLAYSSPPSRVLTLPLGLVYLGIAAGAWQEWRGAVVTGAVLFSLAVVMRIYVLATDFSVGKAGSALVFAWLAYKFVMALRNWDAVEDRGDPPADEEKPMISIVLFLSEPKSLDESVLTEIVEEAWGGDYTSENEDERDGFVVGHTPFFIVKSKTGVFAVHNHPVPYFDDVEEVAGEIGELRLRKAVLDHRAWLSVDLLSPGDESLPLEAYYPAIIRLVYELSDETTSLVYRPETGQVNLWSDDVLEVLLMPSGEERFNRVQNEVPVIRVEADDEEMAAAVSEARRRWSEFVDAFERRGEGDKFSIKAPVTVAGETEFIWIEVDGIASGVVFGKLGNRPVSLEGLTLGSPVEISVADLNDWCFSIKDSEPVGLFTLKAIEAAKNRFRSQVEQGEEA
ncbi:MAG: DUF2314 domain-containing protein [Verrucomicrobiae bacterium]|nr:DUF2314 domain-containing protein [Verrucomicrobiae bacterium]